MSHPPRHAVLVTALAFAAFVSLGLPDGAPGVAWPSVRATFGLPLDGLGALLTTGTAGYLVSSALAGQAVRAAGVGRVLVGSTALVAAGLAGYAAAPRWGWMLACAAGVGLGSGAVDAGLNALAAKAFSPRVVAWLHACYGLGATAGPLVMTAAVTAPGGSWRWGYATLSAALAAMAAGFALTLPHWRAAEASAPTAAAPGTPAVIAGNAAAEHAGAAEAARHPVVWLQMLLFFAYTGTEVTAGQWLYSLLAESRGFSPRHAGLVVGGYWGALTAGRVVFGALAAKVAPLTLLRTGLALAPPAATLLCWRPADWPGVAAAVAGAGLLGFALAPVFPMLISATPARVGVRLSAQAVGFQVSAGTVGIALLPALAGVLARGRGLEVVPPALLAATVVLVGLHETVVAVARRRDRAVEGPLNQPRT